MAISIRITGTREVATMLKTIQKRLGNTKPVFKAVGIQLISWTQRNIDAKGGLHKDSKFKWKPLSPVTIARRRKGKHPEQPDVPLRDSNILYNSFTKIVTNAGVTVFNKAKYAKHHEEGRGRFPPQRKILPTAEQGQEIVLPVFKHFVKEAVK